MKNFFKKIQSTYKTLLLCLLICRSVSVSASILIGEGKTCKFVENGQYKPFSDINKNFPIFGSSVVGDCVDVTNSVDNTVTYGFQVFLGIVTLIAVVQVSVSGIQWMMKDTAASKSDAKKKLTNSLIGLILAMSSWLILNTVNPRVLNLRFNIATSPLQRYINNGVEQAAIATTNGTAAGPGGFVGVGGTVGQNKAPSRFTNQDWADYTRQQIEESGLNTINPKDAAKFFPGGTPSTEGYLRIMEEVIARESSFNPNTTYPELTLGYNSVGLFQLSAVDFNYKYTEEELKDPKLNIKLGVQRFKTLVQRGGCIACGNTSDPAVSGAASYWSVLRESSSTASNGHVNGKRDEIIGALQTP